MGSVHVQDQLHWEVVALWVKPPSHRFPNRPRPWRPTLLPSLPTPGCFLEVGWPTIPRGGSSSLPSQSMACTTEVERDDNQERLLQSRTECTGGGYAPNSPCAGRRIVLYT